MEQQGGSLREQIAIFRNKLEVFKSLVRKNAAISNELHDLFAEANTLTESSQLLRAAADRRIRELKRSGPLISARGRQRQNTQKNAGTT